MRIIRRNVAPRWVVRFVVAVLLGVMFPAIGFEPNFDTTGSARAFSTEGTAEIAWDGSDIDVEWTSVSPQSTVTVTAGDKKVSTTVGEGSVSLSRAHFSEETISITWEREAEASDLEDIEASKSVRDLATTNPEMFVMSSTLGIPIEGAVGEGGFVAPAQAALPASTTFKYMTFIREAYVPTPEVLFTKPCDSINAVHSGRLNRYFKGDNRGFSVNSSKFRTKINVTVDWSLGGRVSASKAVGATERYVKLTDGSYEFDGEATASGDAMKVTPGSTSSTLTKFNLHQDEKNPLCDIAPNGIYSDYTVSVARSGAYTVTGKAMRVPNHEFYVKDSDQVSWTKIFARTGSDFGCLTPGSDPDICLNPTPYSGSR